MKDNKASSQPIQEDDTQRIVHYPNLNISVMERVLEELTPELEYIVYLGNMIDRWEINNHKGWKIEEDTGKR